VFLTWASAKNVYTGYRYYNLLELVIISTTPMLLLNGVDKIGMMALIIVFYFTSIIVYRRSPKVFARSFRMYLAAVLFVILREYWSWFL